MRSQRGEEGIRCAGPSCAEILIVDIKRKMREPRNEGRKRQGRMGAEQDGRGQEITGRGQMQLSPKPFRIASKRFYKSMCLTVCRSIRRFDISLASQTSRVLASGLLQDRPCPMTAPMPSFCPNARDYGPWLMASSLSVSSDTKVNGQKRKLTSHLINTKTSTPHQESIMPQQDIIPH